MKFNKKILLIVISIISVLIIGYTFVYSILYDYYSGGVNIIEVPHLPNDSVNVILPEIEASEVIDNNLFNLDAILKEDIKKEGVFNILLVGLDARNYETYSRSDSMILVSYDMNTQDVKLVSFMRDNWVYLTDRGWSRINAATAYGGVGLLINTINDNFDLDIQYYVQIKFDDFKKVIAILGGIDVELTEAEINYINGKLHTDDNDWNNDIDAEPGVVHLNGSQALWHCRNRTIGNSDFSRTERQREVLSLLIDKARTMSPTEIINLVYQMKDYVNMNIPLDLILSLVGSATNLSDIEVESYSIPFEGMYKFANKNGASVIELNLKENAMKLHEILGLDPESVEIEHLSDRNNYNYRRPSSENKHDSIVEENDIPTNNVEEEIESVEDITTDVSVGTEGVDSSDDVGINVSTENEDNTDVPENLDNQEELGDLDSLESKNNTNNSDNQDISDGLIENDSEIDGNINVETDLEN